MASPRTTLPLLVVALLAACTDPVRDAEIDALGPEDPAIPRGAEHRPGQPCLLCHSEGGPAEKKAFAIAGTVYATNAVGAPGAEGRGVQFVDAKGGGPRRIPEAGPSGNFYVPLADWPDIAFPIRVALYEDDTGGGRPIQTMKSLISREGSCNFCHRPNFDPADIDDRDEKQKAIDDSRKSAGQIYYELPVTP